MSDDLTKRMSHNDHDNDKQRIEKRLDMLIGMVEILGADLQNVKTDLQNVKTDLQNITVRLEALEKTVDERLYDTRPIWERALAEIAGFRSEVTELRTESREVRSEVAGLRTETRELRSEFMDLRSEVTELRTEMREGFYNFGTKIELLLRDMFSLRTDHERLSRRVDDLTPKTT
jgi:chromosome segregation ATPase